MFCIYSVSVPKSQIFKSDSKFFSFFFLNLDLNSGFKPKTTNIQIRNFPDLNPSFSYLIQNFGFIVSHFSVPKSEFKFFVKSCHIQIHLKFQILVFVEFCRFYLSVFESLRKQAVSTDLITSINITIHSCPFPPLSLSFYSELAGKQFYLHSVSKTICFMQQII